MKMLFCQGKQKVKVTKMTGLQKYLISKFQHFPGPIY